MNRNNASTIPADFHSNTIDAILDLNKSPLMINKEYILNEKDIITVLNHIPISDYTNYMGVRYQTLEGKERVLTIKPENDLYIAPIRRL